MNGPRAAHNLEDAYRKMWCNFVSGTDGKPSEIKVPE
jgi:hypothetical protein